MYVYNVPNSIPATQVNINTATLKHYCNMMWPSHNVEIQNTTNKLTNNKAPSFGIIHILTKKCYVEYILYLNSLAELKHNENE